MSKWQLPAQKGTELFPRATRSPVKVRFEGVPAGSPLARELYNQLRGQIDQFYLKAAQNYALGILDQMCTHRSTPEMSMRYINSQGAETVHVVVRKDIVEEAYEAQEKTKGYWDWALFDFGNTVIYNQTGAIEMTARLRIDPNKFVSTWTDTPANTQDVIRFPKPSDVTISGDPFLPKIWRGSLLVDLRPFHGIPELEVDVWAHMWVYDEGPLLGWQAGAWTNISGSSTVIGDYTMTTSLGAGAISGDADADANNIDAGLSVGIPDPRTFWPYGAYLSYYSTGDFTSPSNSFWPSSALIVDGVPIPAPDPIPQTGPADPLWFVHSVIAQHAESGLLNSYTVRFQNTQINSLTSSEATKTLSLVEAVYGRSINEIHEPELVDGLINVYGRCFKEGPRWTASSRVLVGWDQPSTKMWEIENVFPGRPPIPMIRENVVVPAHTDDTPDEGYYIGRAYINIEHGTISFKLAE